MGTNGWLYDMSKDLKGWSGWKDLTDNAVKYSKDAKGRTYYIPYGFYGLSLFYRSDLIKEAGFKQPPASWDELLNQASKIQNPSKRQYGYAFRAGPTPTATRSPSSRRTSRTRSTARTGSSSPTARRSSRRPRRSTP
ncbi:extracellular solute-binding protein [Streptomyces sp. FXJ1.4098]|nr:extracellular solute-binding protein [Streptomyces sp. FXJ1.4098]